MGVAHAVVGELDAAVADLERAVEDEPTNVTWLTDLSAVYIARGRRDSRSADYEAAVVAAGRALGADASLPAACFNRALALEALARGGEARTMWERCLTIEDDSQWAAEIRTHLAAR
jgi:tetratricopeptide (TPR) repeat protein